MANKRSRDNENLTNELYTQELEKEEQQRIHNTNNKQGFKEEEEEEDGRGKKKQSGTKQLYRNNHVKDIGSCINYSNYMRFKN